MSYEQNMSGKMNSVLTNGTLWHQGHWVVVSGPIVGLLSWGANFRYFHGYKSRKFPPMDFSAQVIGDSAQLNRHEY